MMLTMEKPSLEEPYNELDYVERKRVMRAEHGDFLITSSFSKNPLYRLCAQILLWRKKRLEANLKSL